MLKVFFMLFCFIYYFLLCNVNAFDIPKYDGYVTDLANVLDIGQEKILEDKIYNIQKDENINIEIAILIIDSLDGNNIFDIGIKVAESWGVGDNKKDNGILMLFAIDDKEWNIQVGYGLESVITDNIAKRIGENVFPKYFKDGNYYSGIYNAIDDIYNYILKDPSISDKYNSSNYLEEEKSDKSGIIMFFVIIYLFFSEFLIKNFILTRVGIKYKIKKYGKINIFIIGSIITMLLYLFIGYFIVSFIISYGILLFMIGIIMNKTTGSSGSGGLNNSIFGGGMFGGGSGGGGGSFGGGSFGGGGSSGKR